MSGCLSSHFVFHLSLKGLFKLPTKVAFFLHDFNVGLLFIYLFLILGFTMDGVHYVPFKGI